MVVTSGPTKEKVVPRIALIQQHAGEDRDANVERGLRAAREAIANGAELIAFAEVAFDRFFPQKPTSTPPLDRAESIPGPITEAFMKLARDSNVVVVLNLYERQGDQAFDSSPVIDANGELLGVTRMLHIADMEHFHEQGYYTPGDRGMPVYDTAVGRVGVAICYDRHYPEVMRALGLRGAQLVVIPQAGSVGEWPDGLYEAEIRVAAFQNGYFAALANRVGVEEEIEFGGESFVAGPDGRVLHQAKSCADDILIADLDFSEIETSCAKQLFYRDRRPELVADLLQVDTHSGRG